MKIYRSTVPGDQSTTPIETELTPDQHNTHNKAKTLLSRINDGEIAQVQLRKLRAACPHHAFIDTSGIPYDTRTCEVCGSHMGVV